VVDFDRATMPFTFWSQVIVDVVISAGFGLGAVALACRAIADFGH
jgi:hypothetical protein